MRHVQAIAAFSFGRGTECATVFTAVLLASVVVLTGACQSKVETTAADIEQVPATTGQATRQLTGLRVEAVVVQPSERHLELTLPGEVEAHRDALLAAPLGGYVEGVHVQKGDHVKAGQTLVSVDTSTHAARLQRVQTDIEASERELARAESLIGAIPAAELDAARDRLAQARAAKRELSLNVSRSVVRAPFSGYIVDLETEVGEVAAPGAPLLRLVQLQPVNVTVSLSDRDIGLAQIGNSATVSLDARGGQFEGKIAKLSRAADLKTRAFEAVVEVPNADEKLLPGMIANVSLTTKAVEPTDVKAGSQPGPLGSGAVPPAKGTIVISQDWLVTRPSGIGVFLVKDGRAKWSSVVVGEVLRKQVSITEGLSAGDMLIVVGHRDLADGDAVLVQRTGRCCVDGRAVFTE